MNHLLYPLEDEAEGFRRFKLACPDDLHTVIQDALPVQVYCRIDHADGVNLHRVTYYTTPDQAEAVYEKVKLIITDFHAGIRLRGLWWDFIEDEP